MHYSKKAQERITDGLCPICGDKPHDHRRTCIKCRTKYKKAGIKRYIRLRMQVFEKYGQKCQCCGETEEPFLAIDHMKGTTREGDQRNLTEWIVKNNFPDGFRILCHNCNMAVRYGRICPHQQ